MVSNASGVLDGAEEVLRRARAVLDPDHRLPDLHAVRFRAEVTGPGGDFAVTMASTRAGWARIRWDPGPTMAIQEDRTWQRFPEEDATGPLQLVEELFVRGHEVMAMVAWPSTRVSGLRFAGETRFAGQPAIRLTGVDPAGGAVDLFYAVADTMPLGFQIQDHLRDGGPVTVQFDGWSPVEGVLLPHSVEFRQGAEVFLYRMNQVDLSPEAGPEWFEAAGA